jgi:hypothetical protein
MPNKKINALDVRVAVASDLMLVGDPATGTAYKSTLATLPLVPTSRTLTINGVAFDLSANRSWTIDTLPSQTGNSGKYLTTNGTIASWATINLSGYVPYTGATGAVNLGAFGITANLFVKSGGTSAQFLKADGSVDSTSYVTSNIYTANGTLTSSRTLTLGGFNLDFIGSTHTNRFTSAGRLLLGTTTESTFILDVNGTARVNGILTIGATGASFNIAYVSGGLGNINLGGTIGATPDRSIAVGGVASGLLSTAVGMSATASGGGTAIGGYGTTSNSGVAIGSGVTAATANGSQAVAIGGGSTTYSGGIATAIQGNIGTSGNPSNGIAIHGTLVGGISNGSIALMGYAGANQSVAIYGSTSAPGEFVVGSAYDNGDMSNFAMTNVYFGSGKQRANNGGSNKTGAGIDYAINGSGAFGSDFAGGNITIAGGKGTGSGASGDVIISTATPTTSGTTLQTLTQRWWVKGSTGTLSNVASPNASAQVQIDSTTKGFLPPRMTTAQINAIVTPAEGLQIYNTTISHMCVYQAGAWAKLSHSPM